MGCNDEGWAVFWCSLLSPVLLGEIPERQRERYFQELSREERPLPNGKRRRISVRTLRRQWRRLKIEGVPGLYRRRRSDRGKARKRHADLLARAVELKKEQPYRSDQVLNCILKREFGREVPRSTLYRHLKRDGGHAAEAGRLAGEGTLPLDPRPTGRIVGWRLRAWPVGDVSGPVCQDPSFGLDRLPQPLHRRRTVLRPRGPGYLGRFVAAGLGESWCQLRTVRR